MGVPSWTAQGGDAYAQSRASNQGSFYSPFIVNSGRTDWADVAKAVIPFAAIGLVAWLAVKR
jgi:hypothetical protein